MSGVRMESLSDKFTAFGRYYFYLAIIYVFRLFSGIVYSVGYRSGYLILSIMDLIGVFLIFAAISRMKYISKTLNEVSASRYCRKLSASVILSLVGQIFLAFVNLFGSWAMGYFLAYIRNQITSLPKGTMIYVGIYFFGFLLIFFSMLLAFSAYGALAYFFGERNPPIPPKYRGNASLGAKLVRYGVLISVFIMIYPLVFIGSVLAVIGYFKIGTVRSVGSEDSLYGAGDGIVRNNVEDSSERKYCGYCGAPIKPGAKFCTKCGKPV